MGTNMVQDHLGEEALPSTFPMTALSIAID